MQPSLRSVAIISLCFVSLAHAGLDDSGLKPITVRSEICRGEREVTQISTFDAAAFVSAFQALLQANRRKDTDSDGFLLGAYRTMGNLLARYSRDPRFEKANGEKQNATLYIFQGRNFFQRGLQAQRRLGLTDADIANALQVSAETIERQNREILSPR